MNLRDAPEWKNGAIPVAIGIIIIGLIFATLLVVYHP